jgi:SagB-type dehydrogenase family enzyme
MRPGVEAMNTHIPILLTLWLALVVFAGSISCGSKPNRPTPTPTPKSPAVMSLPLPREQGPLSLEQAIARRRSVRSFTDQGLMSVELSQLLWAAQGITDPRGFRAAPSAGALYPLELYVVSTNGFYHYQPHGHQLELLREEDLRLAVWKVGLEQNALRDAPAVFLIAAVFQRTANKYGARTERYVYMEAGHAAQNLLLQAVALGLAAVPIGAFYDDELQVALSLPTDHEPLYLIPVGYPDE